MTEDEDRWDHNRWARISMEYEKNFVELPRQLYVETAILRASPPIERVLYLGAGDGKALVYLRERLPDTEIVGVDPDPAQVKVARARLGRRAKIVKAAVEELPDTLGQFDLILSYMNMRLWRDCACGLGRVQASLTSNGMAYIVDLRSDISPALREAGLRSLPHGKFRSVSEAQFETALSIDQVRDKLEEAGVSDYRLLTSLPRGPARGGSREQFAELAQRMARAGLSRELADVQLHLFVYPE